MRESLTMREALTILVFVAVFAASVVNQLSIRRWAIWVARFDPWRFLPFWAFFAPKPAFADIHLVFRDRDPATLTGWTEIVLPDSNGWRWLWNPGRYERKALHDLVNGLAWTAEQANASTALEVSSCHLGLLAWVMAQPDIEAGSQCRQFAVVQAVGHGSARAVRPVFVSREYSLD